jgi:AcrR family transcriptional regulator
MILSGEDGDGGGLGLEPAIGGAKPEFENQGVDGEADPERDAEELAGDEMGGGTGGEEDTHDGTSGRDAEQDGDGTKQPAAFQEGFAALPMPEGPGEGVEKKRVKEEDGGTLDPSADGEGAHGVGGESDDGAERKEDALRPVKARKAGKDDQRREKNEEERREDVRQGEGGVGSEGIVEARHLGRPAVRRSGEREEASDDDRDSDDDADPETDAERGWEPVESWLSEGVRVGESGHSGNLYDDLVSDPIFQLTICQTKIEFKTRGIVDQTEDGLPCKRPYELGKRREASDRTREAVLSAARELLESGGARDLTMEALAKASGVTRQTIHNLFGTRTGVLEALFDRIAADAGMMRMREVMTSKDAESMLTAFVAVFAGFWVKDQLLLKRIHGIAAVDPEFGQAVQARNQRRKIAANRVIERFHAGRQGMEAGEMERKIAILVALTSFEFFEALAESCGSAEAAAELVYPIVKKAVGI